MIINPVMNYDTWKALHEAQTVLDEAKEATGEIYNLLENFFEEHVDGSYEEAKKYVTNHSKGWELSEKDYNEVKAEIVNEDEDYTEEDKIVEGKIAAIDTLSKASKTKEEFIDKLKEYVKTIDRAHLAENSEFIEAFTSDWTLFTEAE